MNRSLLFGILIVLTAGSRAEAANLAVITAPPTMLNILILVVGIVCAGGAFRVLSVVRGGQLSRSWNFFVAAFAILVVTQVLSVLLAIEVISLPGFVMPACLAIMTGLFLFGVLEAKKTLS